MRRRNIFPRKYGRTSSYTFAKLNRPLIPLDNLAGGVIGKALFIEGIEATVSDTGDSCITDLDKKVPIPGTGLTGSICTGKSERPVTN